MGLIKHTSHCFSDHEGRNWELQQYLALSSMVLPPSLLPSLSELSICVMPYLLPWCLHTLRPWTETSKTTDQIECLFLYIVGVNYSVSDMGKLIQNTETGEVESFMWLTWPCCLVAFDTGLWEEFGRVWSCWLDMFYNTVSKSIWCMILFGAQKTRILMEM